MCKAVIDGFQFLDFMHAVCPPCSGAGILDVRHSSATGYLPDMTERVTFAANMTKNLTLPQLKKSMRRARRSHPHMSLAEMAHVAGVTERTIMRWDDAGCEVEPSLLGVAQIVRHFHISFDEIIYTATSPTEVDAKQFLQIMSCYARWMDTHATEDQKQIFTRLLRGFITPAIRGNITPASSPKM